MGWCCDKFNDIPLIFAKSIGYIERATIDYFGNVRCFYLFIKNLCEKSAVVI